MKKQTQMYYESPKVEIVEFEVEKGFATSAISDGEAGNYRSLDSNSPYNF